MTLALIIAVAYILGGACTVYLTAYHTGRMNGDELLWAGAFWPLFLVVLLFSMVSEAGAAARKKKDTK